MEVPSARTPATSLPRPSPKAKSLVPAARVVSLAFDFALTFLALGGVRLRFPDDLALGFSVFDFFAFCTVAKLIPTCLHRSCQSYPELHEAPKEHQWKQVVI